MAEDINDSEEHHAASRRFHVWLTDWRETARVVIKRRDYHNRLGLARPRSPDKPS